MTGPMQAITRVVDARSTQLRVVLWLACGHYASIDAHATAVDPTLKVEVERALTGDRGTWPCVACPRVDDGPTAAERQQAEANRLTEGD